MLCLQEGVAVKEEFGLLAAAPLDVRISLWVFAYDLAKSSRSDTQQLGGLSGGDKVGLLVLLHPFFVDNRRFVGDGVDVALTKSCFHGIVYLG